MYVEQTVSVVQYKPVVSAALQTLARGTAYKGGVYGCIHKVAPSDKGACMYDTFLWASSLASY